MYLCVHVFFFIYILNVNIASSVEHQTEVSNDAGSIPIVSNIFSAILILLSYNLKDKDPLSQWTKHEESG